ncbi:MAG: TonB-dependent receptor [Opitutales bacterium]|jgi:iron complex outermembrane recepter protein|nr:TonB-dependent receptor [Opitutales bacterium]
MKLPILNLKTLIALVTSIAIISSGLAQDDDAFVLDPFSVTATQGYTATNTISGTGLSTPLKNVPMSINVITSDFLEDSLIGDFNEALDYNTSITQTGRIGGNSARPSVFSIRGFRSRNTLVDGVTGGIFIPTQMIDRIEVVKGPNTLYGQSDPGGLINVITKTPKAQEGGKVTFKVGDNGWYQGQADVTVRAMDDKLGLRVLTDYKEFDGTFALDGRLSKFLGVSGNYALTENSDFIFLLSKNEINQIPVQRSTFGFEEIPTDLNGDGDFDDTVRQIKESRARYNNSFVPRNFTTMTTANFHELDQDFLSLGYRIAFSEDHNLQYKYNFYDTDTRVNFRAFNTFRASDGRSDANYSMDNNKSRDEVHTLNDLINFQTGDVKHQLLLGVRQSETITGGDGTYRLRATRANEAAILDELEVSTGKTFRRFLFKDEVLAGTRIWEEDGLSREEIRTHGIRTNTRDRSFQDIDTYYATDNMYFMEDRLNILAGVRHVKIQQHSVALGGAPQGAAIDVDDTSFQLGGVYRINQAVSGYVNLAEAFEPNGAVNPDTGDFFAPQTSDAIEAGIKFSDLMDGLFSGSATVFQIEKANVVRNDFNPVTFSTDQAVTNDEATGFELELFTSPLENWDVVFAYTYLDAKVAGAISPELEGLRLEGAAPHRVSFFNSYTIDEGPMEGLRIGGGVTWADGDIPQFGTPSNILVAEDGFTLVDFFLRYPTEIGGQNVTFGLNIDNVFDELFVRGRGALSPERQFLFSVSTDL